MQRVLFIGCGDIALRTARLLGQRYQLYGLIRHQDKAKTLRAVGICPIVGDLDQPATLSRISGLAHMVFHFAPPPASGKQDTRTRHLLNALTKRGILPQRLIYISTSGVYGNCAGAEINESRTVNPQTDRACRRVDAERQLRAWGRQTGSQVVILRVPGIYAANRLPIERIRAGLPALLSEEDGYTNHIHAQDLARIAIAASLRGQSQRVYNVVDEDVMKMGDYFDRVADVAGLPRPPRINRAEASQRLTPAMLSFMDESRRLCAHRLHAELKIRLHHPTLVTGLQAE
ncbi:nucleoside-diphosphate-sugar epimerase [Chitinivorax tropicus]|uniref:Nucleoside-diphosphate-sugar epimerase n=1 Tax=Chitinivorax tropicus TaxID=714531 RepID=A0A840MVP3_9PROT|nr:SDR family oxidoreductase [Chitinivorax tropicus]MBB5020423.1 nucleoside-diphosphate-sugar epimerase [Chitinivorax tropicus]